MADNISRLPTLEVFRQVNRNFPKTAEILALKQQGTKIFGWSCTYTPEEVLHAAGILPVRITGYQREMELEDGNAYLYINNCSFTRSCLQMALDGKYDHLDGLVAGSTCDGARRLFDLWRHYLEIPFSHVLTVPRKFTESARALYYQQVQVFKQSLESNLGVEISDAALLNSIEVYNQARRLLKRLYDLRRQASPPISGAEVLEVLNASFRMPKESFNRLLEQLLQELESCGIEHHGRARLMISGSVMNNPEFVKSIEDAGGLVVTDELCTGTRYWSDPVVLDGKPVLKAISDRYLGNAPCARMVPSDERFNRIQHMIDEYRVDGVISQVIRYCVPYAHDLPLLAKRLNDTGIPMLTLDVEYGTSGSGQIHTRVQAFLEMLEAKRK